MIILYRTPTVVMLLMGLCFGQASAANPYAGKTCTGPYETGNKVTRGAYVLEFNAAGTGGALFGNKGSFGDQSFKQFQANPDIPKENLRVDKWGSFSVTEEAGQFGAFPYNFVLHNINRGTTLYLSALSPQGTATGRDDISARYYAGGANELRLTCHDRAK